MPLVCTAADAAAGATAAASQPARASPVTGPAGSLVARSSSVRGGRGRRRGGRGVGRVHKRHQHSDVIHLAARELLQVEAAALEGRPHQLLPPGQVQPVHKHHGFRVDRAQLLRSRSVGGPGPPAGLRICLPLQTALQSPHLRQGETTSNSIPVPQHHSPLRQRLASVGRREVAVGGVLPRERRDALGRALGLLGAARRQLDDLALKHIVPQAVRACAVGHMQQSMS